MPEKNHTETPQELIERLRRNARADIEKAERLSVVYCRKYVVTGRNTSNIAPNIEHQYIVVENGSEPTVRAFGYLYPLYFDTAPAAVLCANNMRFQNGAGYIDFSAESAPNYFHRVIKEKLQRLEEYKELEETKPWEEK